MKRPTLAAATFLSCLCAAFGSATDKTIQWPDGRIWAAVQVVDMDSVSVTICHDSGASARVMLEDLPPDAQQWVKQAGAAARKRRSSETASEASWQSSVRAEYEAAHPAMDIVLKNGTSYPHARIVSVDAATASIQNETGVTRVLLEDLPDPLRSKVAPNYSTERATAFLTQEAQAQRQAAEAQARAQSEAALDARIKPLWFDGTVKQITEDGILAAGRVYVPAGAFPTYKEDRYGVVRQQAETVDWQVYDQMMIQGVADDSLVDGSAWKGMVYAIGHYQFTTVLGAPRTIPGFTASKDTAREYAARHQ